VIAGGPGSGKSSAAILLILTALRHRRSVPEKARPEVPVPVMFTLHGWDPGTQRARDWLAERLWQAYPLFGGKRGAGAARGMLDESRIAVLLDGLDEIPEDLRPAVLRALSQQATFRLVLLTRSAEMADAAARAMLQGAGAIELQDIAPGVAAGYLIRTQLDPLPHGWHELTSRLRQEPGSPLAQALNNPLMLTLVRDTYRAGDDVSELLGLRDAAGHPASGQEITGHLLDRVLPAAYTQQPGEPPHRYDLATAERALRCIATRMNNAGTRDLQWWHVPAWAHAAPRVIVTCLATCLVVGLGSGLGTGLRTGLVAWLFAGLEEGFRAGLGQLVEGFVGGLVGGLVLGLVLGYVFGRGDKIPKRIAPVRWRQLFRRTPLVLGLLAALLIGVPIVRQTWVAGYLFGLVAGLMVWLGSGLVAGMSRPGTDSTSPLNTRLMAQRSSARAHGRACNRACDRVCTGARDRVSLRG
jgi:hypothetical protein